MSDVVGLADFADQTELFIALVAAIGTDMTMVSDELRIGLARRTGQATATSKSATSTRIASISTPSPPVSQIASMHGCAPSSKATTPRQAPRQHSSCCAGK